MLVIAQAARPRPCFRSALAATNTASRCLVDNAALVTAPKKGPSAGTGIRQKISNYLTLTSNI
jgi:hypothetical protein